MSNRSRPLRNLASLVLLVAVGCVAEEGCGTPPPDCLAPLPLPEGPFALDRVAAGFVDEGVRVRGFAGAAPPSTKLTVSLDSESMEVESDASGRFDAVLPAGRPVAPDAGPLPEVRVSLAIAGEPEAFVRARSLPAAHECAVGAPLPTGTGPNDLAIARCGDTPVSLVVDSIDATLAAIPFEGSERPPAASFPVDEGDRAANPWAVALDTSGERAVVSLYGQHTIALVEPCTGRVLDVAAPTRPDGAPLLLDVTPAVELDAPIDADGDGETETTITRMLPRHPEGVAIVGDRVLVGYTNGLQFGATPRAGPGVVVAFDIEGDTLRPAGHVVLPFGNPQAITLDGEGRPWVSCSATLAPGPFGFAPTADGGLVRLDADSLEVEESIAFGRFAPGTPAFDGAHVVVGSLVRPEIAVLPAGATDLEEGLVLPVTDELVTESLFEAVALGDGLFLVTELSADRVHLVDAATGELDPWPFEGGLSVGPAGLAFRGAQALALDPGFPWGDDAPDAALLLGQSREVVPLRIWQVLGP